MKSPRGCDSRTIGIWFDHDMPKTFLITPLSDADIPEDPFINSFAGFIRDSHINSQRHLSEEEINLNNFASLCGKILRDFNVNQPLSDSELEEIYRLNEQCYEAIGGVFHFDLLELIIKILLFYKNKIEKDFEKINLVWEIEEIIQYKRLLNAEYDPLKYVDLCSYYLRNLVESFGGNFHGINQLDGYEYSYSISMSKGFEG